MASCAGRTVRRSARLLRRLAEQDAVVGHDADRVAVNTRKAADERLAEERFEFVEVGAVHNARNDFTHIIGLAAVVRDDAVEFLAGTGVERVSKIQAIGLTAVETADRAAHRVPVRGGRCWRSDQ